MTETNNIDDLVLDIIMTKYSESKNILATKDLKGTIFENYKSNNTSNTNFFNEIDFYNLVSSITKSSKNNEPLILNSKYSSVDNKYVLDFDFKGQNYVGSMSSESLNDFQKLLNERKAGIIKTDKSIEKMFGEDIAYSLKQNIGRDIQNVSNLENISFNKVYDGKLKDTNEEVIIKVTNNYQKAKIECLANYYLSQHPVLGKVIAPSVIEEPVALEDGVWLTVQKKIHDKKEYSTMHYISSLALLHSYGKGIMTRNAGIILPEWEAKSFDELLDNISINENPAKFKHLKQRYNEIAHELRTRPEYVLIHGDAKKDNLTFGKLLDLEGVKNGHPSIDLSICLAQSGVPTEHWDKYLGIYCDIVKNETGINYTHKDLKQLTDLTKKAYVVTGLKEYSGISSRPIRKQQNYQMHQLLFGLI